jgi:DNA-binding YbaB/EbfC family protein
MTQDQNPFEALRGGFDMGALLQQAQQMQEQLQLAQERLSDQIVTGQVSGGAVRVSVNGIGDLVAVSIDPGAVDGSDAESLADLGDLVVAAYRDAKSQADQLAASALGPMAGGFGGAPPVELGGVEDSGGHPLGFGPSGNG